MSLKEDPIYKPSFYTCRTGDWVADHYQQTAVMSTYLLAFIICDFEYTENMTRNNITVWRHNLCV